jgi:hypothetical protein
MDPGALFHEGFESLPALAAATGVLIGAWLLIDRLVSDAFAAADAIRGRDHCHYCGTKLPTPGGLGHSGRCRTCERAQPWG